MTLEPSSRRKTLDETGFHAVFVHDAIACVTAEADLRAAIQTAVVRCRAGGAALFALYCMCETFHSSTDHRGHDGDGRVMRYQRWT